MTVKVEEEGDSTKRWGTWEQLILGGAVLRHGTNHWDIVASELHTRSLHPFLFTPEACKAKYEDLQLHYSGNTAWFEELRKQRVAELKRALEKSEDSIGSLESKLESLEAEKGSCGNADCSCSQTESSFPFPKSEENELSGKYMSKDRLSAGSFTQETHANWLPRCQTAVKGLAEQAETKPRLQSPNKEHLLIIDKLAQAIQPEGGVSIRRKRGKRKRKDCSKHVMEGSVGENNLLSSVNVGATTSLCKENLTSDCGETVRCSDANDHDQGTGKEEFDDLMGFLDSVMQNEHASVFRRRLDSQKRARYKKTVRQHMDLDIIRSKITRKSITSAEELLRDLLLIASNALIFYSKCTREYKCASRLRGLVTERLRQHYKASGNVAAVAPAGAGAVIPKSPMRKPPAKRRSARPFNCKSTSMTINTKNASPAAPKGVESPRNAAGSPQSMESSAQRKKTAGGQRGKIGRVKHGDAGMQAETPIEVRKSLGEMKLYM